MTPRLRIDESRLEHVTILRLKGRLEIEEGNELLRERVNELVKAGRFKIVLDMAGVTRLDSMGLGILATYLLEITRLSSVFEIFEHEGDAVRSFATPPAIVT